MYNFISTQLPFQTKVYMPERYYWSNTAATSVDTKPARTDSSSSPTSTINDENSDDHFNRHLENLVTNLNEQFEDEEEYDDDDDVNNETENETKTIGDDDKDDLTSKDDEPKVFQVEDVDLPPLITSSLSKTLAIASPNTTSISLFNTSKTVIKLSMTNNQASKLNESKLLNQHTNNHLHTIMNVSVSFYRFQIIFKKK
jgi:hypothetical protein